jgi:hypothetical protein
MKAPSANDRPDITQQHSTAPHIVASAHLASITSCNAYQNYRLCPTTLSHTVVVKTGNTHTLAGRTMYMYAPSCHVSQRVACCMPALLLYCQGARQ